MKLNVKIKVNVKANAKTLVQARHGEVGSGHIIDWYVSAMIG